MVWHNISYGTPSFISKSSFMVDECKIIVVDDHDFFRKGLILALGRLKNVRVVGEAATGIEFLELFKRVHADVVFMDIKMPDMNGIEATKIATREYRDIKIIALTMNSEKEYFLRMMDAGAKGFLLKDAGIEELEKAIQTVVKGRNYYPQGLAKLILFNKNIQGNN